MYMVLAHIHTIDMSVKYIHAEMYDSRTDTGPSLVIQTVKVSELN